MDICIVSRFGLLFGLLIKLLQTWVYKSVCEDVSGVCGMTGSYGNCMFGF